MAYHKNRFVSFAEHAACQDFNTSKKVRMTYLEMIGPISLEALGMPPYQHSSNSQNRRTDVIGS